MDGESRRLTPTRLTLIAVITTLSLAHHVDHVVRGVTGWPFDGGFNPFSASLFVYPVIALGVLLTARGRAGPAFWIVLAVHVGPAAGDDVGGIASQHESTAAAVVALAVLAGLFLALLAHCAYELRLLRGERA